MQVHQTQEGNLSLLVPNRPVENSCSWSHDSLTAKTNKNQQEISTIAKHGASKNTNHHARFYQIPEEEKFHLSGSSWFSHYKKKQESRKVQAATKLLQKASLPMATTRPRFSRQQESVEKQTGNQTKYSKNEKNHLAFTGYEKGSLCPRRGPPLVRGWREEGENDDDGRGVAVVVVGFSRRCPKNQK